MARRSILRVALTSSIFEAKVREPPHVAKAYCIGDAGKGKVELTSPSSPLIHLFLCCLLLFLLSHLGLVAFLGLVYQDVERLCQLLLLGDNHPGGGDYFRASVVFCPDGLAIVPWMERDGRMGGVSGLCLPLRSASPIPPLPPSSWRGVEPLGKYHADVLFHRPRPQCALCWTQRNRRPTICPQLNNKQQGEYSMIRKIPLYDEQRKQFSKSETC